MWQSMLRNWLLGNARQQLRGAAARAAGGASDRAEPKTAAEQGPPSPKRDVCHVGLVFALGIEAGGLLDRLQGVILTEGAGFVAREGGLRGKRLVLIESGVGRAAAVRAAEALVLGHRPRWIISAGFAGGLHQSVAQGDIVLADQIVDTLDRCFDIYFKLADDSANARRRLHVGRLLTSDAIVHQPSDKQALGRRYGALAVDMESIAVADVCRREKVRFLAVRVISDSVHQTLPADIDYLVKRRTTAGRLGAAAGAILRRPSSIKDMWQLKEDALVASERLAGFLNGIIEQLP
jgi:adenosylhomocysteine nucleosidase